MGGLNLQKGGRIDLSKGSSVTKFYVGLGWDAQVISGGQEYDLDVSAFMLDYNEMCPSNAHVVYYAHLKDAAGSVVHNGDNLTGAGAGDDEAIIVDISKVPADIKNVEIFVTIHEAVNRNQNFGGVRNAYIRVCENDKNGTELAKFDLEEDYSAFTAVHFGTVYNKDGEWKFKAVGDGFANDLNGILNEYQKAPAA